MCTNGYNLRIRYKMIALLPNNFSKSIISLYFYPLFAIIPFFVAFSWEWELNIEGGILYWRKKLLKTKFGRIW